MDNASVHVPPPTLTVSALPTTTKPNATVTVQWNTGSGVPGAVMVILPGANSASGAGYGNNGTTTYPGIEYTKTYVFQLYTIGLHHRLLAEDTVAHGTASGHIVALSWTPPEQPAVVDRLLQFSPFVIGLLLLGLAAAYLRSLRVAQV